ncbi:MAG: DUF364 domain-containing protein [Desulfobacterales bacterium]|jgi:hypothetical protein|nr:DUF364 domain-containing protein [Desulfobacterales bacterium]
MNALNKMKNKFLDLIEEKQIGALPIQVSVRDLTPKEAIGVPEDQDYPLVKGRERLLEAEILGCRGQAFTDTPGNFSGTVKEVALLQLTDNRSRAVFIAALNALMRHLNLIEKTIHCKDASPPLCASDLVKHVQKNFGSPRIAMLGFQPRMVEALAKTFALRVTDLDQDNIGQRKFGVLIQGPDQTQENISWCDLVVATGSTVVNGTMDTLLDGKPTIFFGVTISGPAVLLGQNRYCPYGS